MVIKSVVKFGIAALAGTVAGVAGTLGTQKVLKSQAAKKTVAPKAAAPSLIIASK